MGKLQLQQISKSYDDLHVLQDVSFHVDEGEFVSIVGPSGSGKSTLFQLIGGLYPPDHGKIMLDGKTLNNSRGHISYMPQNASLFPWRTILENVLLSSEIAGQKDTATALELIEKAGLSGYEQAYPHQLSGGMKQRVAFIRSLNSPQSIICLDEPFSALDEFTRFEMQEWLLAIWEQYRKSIVFITHNIEEALYLSDRILILSDKPASIRKEISVSFPRPRTEDMLLSEPFMQLKREIHHELRGK
ncbi:ABC transporter ATP-binding protein [Sporosarcina sp. FSL K6-2383]|uniref:ABC transporter ATP-binding protein n=1 Tax=Sporosarcina sp. FSL K6-2383 TaxID=2921556 RepID=UPI00315A186E